MTCLRLILHKYSGEMSTKSEVLVVDVLMKNEAKHCDMIEIMERIQVYLRKFSMPSAAFSSALTLHMHLSQTCCGRPSFTATCTFRRSLILEASSCFTDTWLKRAVVGFEGAAVQHKRQIQVEQDAIARWLVIRRTLALCVLCVYRRH